MFHVEQNDLYAVIDWKDGCKKFDCYAKIGQHSTCSIDYINDSREAEYFEYQFLLAELISVGYKNIEVVTSQKTQGHRPPTESEIKFGMGATHYLDFQMNLRIRRDGTLKNRILNKTDGLWYSFK